MKTYNNSASLEPTKRLSDMVNVARESGELMERDKDCKKYFSTRSHFFLFKIWGYKNFSYFCSRNVETICAIKISSIPFFYYQL